MVRRAVRDHRRRPRRVPSAPGRARPSSRATSCSCAPARCTGCDQGDKDRYADISPGIGVGAVEWLHDNDVAAIATDTHVFEPYPCEGDKPFLFPVHMIELRDIGLPQGQQWDLDELAADCAADGVYEFLLAATPLPVTHAVGGLVAPTATK